MGTNRFISLLFFSISLLVAQCEAARMNFNAKSGFLSRVLGNSPKQTPPSSKPSTTTTAGSTTTVSTERNSKGKVSLDLSGTFHCLVAGPTQQQHEGGTTPVPLLETGAISKGWSPPSLVFSVGYNFSHAWYGATRLLTKLQWSYRNKDDNMSQQTAGSPLTVNIQGEKGLLEPNEYAAQVGLSLKSRSDKTSPPSLELRWEQTCQQVTIAAPIHKRVQVVWRSIFPTLQHSLHSENFLSSSIPAQNKEDWWMPNLKMNTAGRLTADNQVGFHLPNSNKRHRMGVRLLFSRQLGWSAFGDAMDDHLGTVMKLQVTGTDDKSISFSTLTMQSILERPLASTHLTLSHEQFHKKQ